MTAAAPPPSDTGKTRLSGAAKSSPHRKACRSEPALSRSASALSPGVRALGSAGAGRAWLPVPSARQELRAPVPAQQELPQAPAGRRSGAGFGGRRRLGRRQPARRRRFRRGCRRGSVGGRRASRRLLRQRRVDPHDAEDDGGKDDDENNGPDGCIHGCSPPTR